MKKDIKFLKVENIALAIVPEESPNSEIEFLTTYLINLKEVALNNVFIRAKGSGMVEDEKIETSTLRILFERINPMSFIKIDDFDSQAAALSNEYWISFKENGYLYDKKYVFVPGSLEKINFTKIPLLERQGVLIK